MAVATERFTKEEIANQIAGAVSAASAAQPKSQAGATTQGGASIELSEAKGGSAGVDASSEQQRQASANTTANVPPVAEHPVRMGGRRVGEGLYRPTDVAFTEGASGTSAVGSNLVEVSNVQRMLVQMGCAGLAVDNKYGKHTAQAVKAVQTALGLSPTGVMTVGDYQAIDAVLKAEDQHKYAAAVSAEFKKGSGAVKHREHKDAVKGAGGDLADGVRGVPQQSSAPAEALTQSGNPVVRFFAGMFGAHEAKVADSVASSSSRATKENSMLGVMASVPGIVQTANASQTYEQGTIVSEKIRLSKQDREQLLGIAQILRDRTGDAVLYNSVVDFVREQSEFDHGGPLQGLYMGQKNRVMAGKFSKMNEELAKVLAYSPQLSTSEARTELAQKLADLVTDHNIYQSEKLQKTESVANKATGVLMGTGVVAGVLLGGATAPVLIGGAAIVALARAGIRFAGRGAADYGIDSFIKDAAMGTAAAAGSLAIGTFGGYWAKDGLSWLGATKAAQATGAFLAKEWLRPALARIGGITVGQTAGIALTLGAVKLGLDRVNNRNSSAQATKASTNSEKMSADANP